ncbi:SoxR reducing system RseC family protein [Rhodocyclus purpureus]|uniref:SoxR reducing system RseC family protein n=1 Tax=Rhodocyclus purpureus TaxID=1067 RepID=UPI0019126634|nr:SoxR reducing system RseC family protein [Rhodocyclus purpureus]MBK5914282.1 hypothetical protein [Rhodocyclus purpureus]
MPEPSPPVNPAASRQMVEDFARVVAADADFAWLEPEQGPSCGACSASAACGAKGIGTLASKLEARRFALPQPADEPRFRVGERIVVGVGAPTLVSGAAIAYMLPLLTLFGAGFVAQALDGRDGVTLLASIGGLCAGLALAALLARRMSARGGLALHYLRRAGAATACIPSGGGS